MNQQAASKVVVKDVRDISTLEVVSNFLKAQPALITDDRAEIILGEGAYRFRLINNWAKLPAGWKFADVAAIDILPDDRVVVFGRSDHPLVVFDRDGNVVDSWGEGIFKRPHGIHYGHDGMLYCIDDGDHTVKKFTPDGRLLLTIGTPGSPAPYMSGKPFSRPTDAALSPSGEIYVTDGYLNAHVHKFDAEGRHLLTWGGSGIGPGEFNIPHNIACDPDGKVYVADRENHRIQVFDANGRFEMQWNYFHRPAAFQRHTDGTFLVGELGPSMPHIRYAPNLGPRIRIVSSSGEILSSIGDALAADAADRFIAPHAIGMDSHGDIYLGEVATSFWSSLFPGSEAPDPIRSLRKLERI